AFGNVIRRCIAKAISGCLAIRAIYGFDINRISPSYTEVRWHIGLVVGSLFPSLKRMRKAKKMPHFMCQRVGTSYETGLCDSYCFICRTEVSAGLIGIAYDVYINHPGRIVVTHHSVTIGLIVLEVIVIVDVADRIFHEKLDSIFKEISVELA